MGHEHASKGEFEDEHKNVVELHPVLDVIQGEQDRQWHDEQVQHDEQHTQAVHANIILDVHRTEAQPGYFVNVLQCRHVWIERRQQHQAKAESQNREAKRDPFDLVFTRFRKHKNWDYSDQRQKKYRRHQQIIRHRFFSPALVWQQLPDQWEQDHN
jgi:hypothetical protein